MNHGSLFSGIGGFDLAAQWMGWDNKFHCEWNEFGQRILKHYWPNAESYGDITQTDFTIWRGLIDILTGGFPCQPYSTAGKRKGKEDERHLWPEMLRAIREIKPSYVVGENVYGLINWNGGLVFNEVQDDLENEGYEVMPVILPAASVGAPHRRDRVWFVAYSEYNGNSKRPKEIQRKGEGEGVGQQHSVHESFESSTLRVGSSQPLSNPIGGKQKIRTHNDRVGGAWKQDEKNTWNEFPTEYPVCIGNDGLSSQLDGITFPKWRAESIKAYGNAIVPQVAYEIFKVIEQIENPTQLQLNSINRKQHETTWN